MKYHRLCRWIIILYSARLLRYTVPMETMQGMDEMSFYAACRAVPPAREVKYIVPVAESDL